MNFLIENGEVQKYKRTDSFFVVTSCPPQPWYPNDPSPKRYFNKNDYSLKTVCNIIRKLYPNSIIIKSLKQNEYRLARNSFTLVQGQ